MIVVSNSSPLIALSSVDRLDIMQLLFETVIIPVSVRDEVMGTLGLLILAKRKGFLSAVRPIMAQIIERVNFRIAPSVLNRALSLIDEPFIKK